MMDAFLHQLRASLRLHFRNRMALIYSYLFPTIFLIAFWVLYRYERVPLAPPHGRAADRHRPRRRLLRLADDDGERA